MLSRYELATMVQCFARLEVKAIETMAERDLYDLADLKTRLLYEAEQIRLHDLNPFRDEPGIFADHYN